MSRETAEVAIVGGDLVGAATAYFLSGEGVDCVVERDGITSHASGFSYAALGTCDEAGMDAPTSTWVLWACACTGSWQIRWDDRD